MNSATIILIAFLSAASLTAAEGEDSVKAKPGEGFKKNLTEKTDPSLKQKKGKKDFFIDKDGDGICDNRAKGMSFERERKRRPAGKGGRGNGFRGGE